ncbi:MAG: AAA-associated domain-containing protein, partial [Phycisphaerae bacterium]
LVDTPKRTVVLAAEGQRFLRAAPDQRAAIWRERILTLGLFQEIRDLLAQQPDHEIDRELVLETIIFRMPQEDYERTFKIVVHWGRYGDLFAYDEHSEKLSQ